MKTPLLENESVVFEKGGSLLGAVALTKGGHVILTNQRFLYEPLVGAKEKPEVEIMLKDIVSYRKAYNISIGQLLPVKNAVTVFTTTGLFKFAMNKSDELFHHFKTLIPTAEYMEDEKYSEGLVGIGNKVVSNVKGAVSGAQGNPSSKSNMSSANTSNTSNISSVSCPHCKEINLRKAKFCNSCGEKLQLECPNCNAPIEEGKKFCAECGTPIKRKNECLKCGAVFGKGQKFCNECGERLCE